MVSTAFIIRQRRMMSRGFRLIGSVAHDDGTLSAPRLAPDIVDAILAGRQPAHLTLKDLLHNFQVEWDIQRRLFVV